MPDDLRTRIAAAIRAVDDMRVCKLHDADVKFITEAVIRELNLHEENGWFGPTNIPKHRYVTEWVADE